MGRGDRDPVGANQIACRLDVGLRCPVPLHSRHTLSNRANRTGHPSAWGQGPAVLQRLGRAEQLHRQHVLAGMIADSGRLILTTTL